MFSYLFPTLFFIFCLIALCPVYSISFICQTLHQCIYYIRSLLFNFFRFPYVSLLHILLFSLFYIFSFLYLLYIAEPLFFNSLSRSSDEHVSISARREPRYTARWLIGFNRLNGIFCCERAHLRLSLTKFTSCKICVENNQLVTNMYCCFNHVLISKSHLAHQLENCTQICTYEWKHPHMHEMRSTDLASHIDASLGCFDDIVSLYSYTVAFVVCKADEKSCYDGPRLFAHANVIRKIIYEIIVTITIC